MDYTVATPLGALGWEPSPEQNRGESNTNLTVVPKKRWTFSLYYAKEKK
jgi:hypothetical protein